MQITLHIKCPTCPRNSIKKNGTKLGGKQNYQCKIYKRQFIGNHAPAIKIVIQVPQLKYCTL